MKLNEFFGQLNLDQQQHVGNGMHHEEDEKLRDDVFWFVLDDDDLHKQFFIPVADKVKNHHTARDWKTWIPMVKAGSLKYLKTHNIKGDPRERFNKEFLRDVCQRIDDHYRENELKENFADGQKPGRKGLAKRSGVDCSQSVGDLRKVAARSSGERQRMAHWCANMKSGRQRANEGKDVEEFKSTLKEFLPMAKAILGLKKLPTIVLKKSLSYGGQPTMGRFNSDSYTLEIAVINRQPVDILRTLAHELAHAKQASEHEPMSGATGSHTENQANMIAGIIMRQWNKLRPELLKSTPVMEGGNVFAGKTTAIKREFIQPTLDAYFSELRSIFPRKAKIFNSQHFVPLGSVGKKAHSGDIDLGVSAHDLVDKDISDASIAEWGIDPKEVQADFEGLTKRARTARPEQLKMKAFLRQLTLYINAHAPTLYCDEKKVSNGNIFGLFPQTDENGQSVGSGVQIDWMVGDLNWLRFSYHSSAYPEGSNVKGLHRTQLMLSAFQVAGLSFNHVDGVKDKDTGEVIARDPAKALKILGDRLGFPISQADAEDYYKLHKLFKERMKPEDYNTLLNIYLKILDSTRADIPDDLHTEWRNRKDILGLSGKFLPDSSALKVQQ